MSVASRKRNRARKRAIRREENRIAGEAGGGEIRAMFRRGPANGLRLKLAAAPKILRLMRLDGNKWSALGHPKRIPLPPADGQQIHDYRIVNVITVNDDKQVIIYKAINPATSQGGE